MGALLGIVLGVACTTVPPNELKRNQLLWDAARECELQLGTVRPEAIGDDGQLEFTLGQGSEQDVSLFMECYRQRAREKLEVAFPPAPTKPK